ncbi:MAG: TorF family putative porin [Robiginitomaculum sp.]
MKKLFVKLALTPIALPLLILGASTYAIADDTKTLSVNISTDYVTEYVFRGVTLAGEAFQPGAEASYGNFTAGVWVSLASGEESAAFDDEIDLYAGYAFDINDKVSANIGATLYHYPQKGGLFDIGKNDASTIEPYGGLSFNVPFSPSLTAYYDVTLDAFTIEGGAEYSIPMGGKVGEKMGEKTNLDISGAIGSVSVDGGTDYQYGSLSLALSYALASNTSVYAGVNGGLSSKDSFVDTNFDLADLANTVGAPNSSSVWFSVGISSGF